MGQDYSYSQPDSSDEYNRYSDNTEDREIEALIHMDEAESNFNHDQASQYPPQPEVEFGFPKVCYCGGQPIVATCYTRNDPCRRFYTCGNVDDGEMHVHKWWDVAVMEELTSLSDTYAYLDQIRATIDDYEQKLLNLDKVVVELGQNNTRFRNGFHLVVGIMAFALVVIAMMVMLN